MKKVGEPFKNASLEKRYDAIVIGSGMGSLATAALLSKAGRSVLVLERHYTAGGFTHTFTRPGYEWDVGVHYIGNVHEGAMLRQIFDHLTEGRLQWAPMDPVYDRAIFPDARYDFVSGEEAFASQMTAYFPEDAEGIQAYLKSIHESEQAMMTFFSTRAMPPLLSKILNPILCRRFFSYSDKTVLEFLQSLTGNRKLMGVLSTQWGDYGLTPSKASFAIHAMVAIHYLKGGFYPVGGAGRIATTVAPTIQEGGGRILINAEVKRILHESGRVRGVRLKDDTEIHAELVISGIGLTNTMSLLPPEIRIPSRIRADLKTEVKPSISHICLYVGLPYSASELGLERTNLWIYPDYDHDSNMGAFLANPGAKLPVVYISFPSAKDPDWENRHPRSATIEVISLVSYEWFDRWKESRWYRRGSDYEGFKEQLSERLLEVLYQYVPQVKGKIGHCELSTPLSTKHFANYQHGEIYGLQLTPQRFRLHWLRPKFLIPGLFLTGQDIAVNGIAGALISGVLTASSILKKNLMKSIVK